MGKRVKKHSNNLKVITLALVTLPLLVLAIVFFSSSSGEEGLHLEDIHGMAVDISNPDRLYIANHHGLYAHTAEAGLSNVSTVSSDFMSLALHPEDPNILFVSGHPEEGGNLGLQQSADKGLTWKTVSEGLDGPVDFHAMAVDKQNPAIIYGVHGGEIQRSADNGLSWILLDGLDVDIYQLVSDTDGTLYAATLGGLMVSYDKGTTWSRLPGELSTAAVVAVAVNPSNTDSLLSYSREAKFASSADSGKTWKTIASGFFGDQIILFIDYSPEDPNIVFVATNDLNIYKSKDGGTTWAQEYGQ